MGRRLPVDRWTMSGRRSPTANDHTGWSAAARLAAEQHGAMTRKQARDAGVIARDVRRLLDAGLLHEPVPGVLVFNAARQSLRQRLWVATHAAGGGFLVAGAAAAWLHSVEGFGKEPAVEVIGARGRRLPPIAGLIQRSGQVAAADRQAVDGIPCVGLARTICDIAAQFGPDSALRAIDDFERRGFSMNWLAQTAARLHRPGQTGTRTVIRLLGQRTGRAPDTWFERLVESCLRLPGLPPWEHQHWVCDGRRRVARVDLACVPLRLAVEAHSRQFHFGSGPESADQRRDTDLAALGWDVSYVGWHAATRTPEAVAADIDRIARRRAADLGIALPWAA